MNLTDINKNRKRLEAELKELSKQEAEITSYPAVICESNNYGKGCGAGFYINTLEYIQSYWYERPHGCTGGDTWHQGEGRFKCPKCGHMNRLYNRQNIQLLKNKFKSVVDYYDKN